MYHLIRKIFNELYLLWTSPKEYLYMLTLPTDKKIKIMPYDPKANTVGNDLVEIVKKHFPELEVYFVGAANLGITGQGDIDLVVASPAREFKKYIPALIKRFGKLSKERAAFADWEFTYKGYKVELTLTYKDSELYHRQLKIFNLLQNNKEVLQAYEQLKVDSAGLPVRVYMKRRLLFFNLVMRRK